MMTRDRFANYLTGIPALDDEHWDILSEMDNVIFMFKSRDHEFADLVAEMHKVIHQLTTHLHTEESYMIKIGYPYLEYHQVAHAKLIADAVTISNTKHGQYRRDLFGDILNGLSDNLLTHIDHYDIQMTDWHSQQKLAVSG